MARNDLRNSFYRDCFTTVDPEAAPVIAKHHKIEPLGRAALFPGQTLPSDITKDELYALLGLHKLPSPSRRRGRGVRWGIRRACSAPIERFRRASRNAPCKGGKRS